MAKYVEFPLEGGGSIYIEATEEIGRGSAGFLRGEGTDQKSAQSFDSTVESIRRSADLMLTKLRGLSTAPDRSVAAIASDNSCISRGNFKDDIATISSLKNQSRRSCVHS